MLTSLISLFFWGVPTDHDICIVIVFIQENHETHVKVSQIQKMIKDVGYNKGMKNAIFKCDALLLQLLTL